jgi:hypothetical protein
MKDFNDWFRFLVDNKPSHPLQTTELHSDVTLFTDASKIGWGAVMLKQHQVFTTGGKWSPAEAQKHINILEARAVQEAIDYFEDDLSQRNVTIVVDNTSVIGAMHRRRSNSYELNAALSQVLQRLERINSAATVSYIASDEQGSTNTTRS